MFIQPYMHTPRSGSLGLLVATVLFTTGCATAPKVLEDPWSTQEVSRYISEAGAADAAIESEKREQADALTNLSAAGAERLLQASSPVTQSALRWVAFETILRTEPGAWQSDWTSEAIALSDLGGDPALLKLLARHPGILDFLEEQSELYPSFVAAYVTLVAAPDLTFLEAVLQAWQERATPAWGRYLQRLPATTDPVVPKRKGPVGLALPFSGPSGSAGWRLGFAYLAGIENHGPLGRPIHFLDTSQGLTEAMVASDTGPSELAWVTGPFRKQAVLSWSPLLTALELSSIGFAPRTDQNDRHPPIRLAQNHGHNARVLASQLLEKLGVRTINLFVPANNAGDTFVRAFAEAVQACADCSITGISWYNEDLQDLTARARMHYGADRYTDAWLKDNEKERNDVDGILQAEVTVVQATADNLQRVLGELIYFGSTFQTFAGDYNFGAVKQLESLRLRAPLLFVDHYYRPDIPQQATPSMQRFERAVASSTSDKPILPDLLMYEAGELTAQDAFRTGKTVQGAAGELSPDADSSWQLPLYPLMVSDRVVMPADFDLLRSAREAQGRRKQNFLKRQAEMAEMKEKKAADKDN